MASKHGKHISILSLEGLIGAGKTTQINLLKDAFLGDPRVAFVDEPVDEWDNRGFLSAMYDGELDSGTFQMMALMSRLAPIMTAMQNTKVQVIVTERSWLSDYFVFARANLNGIKLQAYQYTFSKLQKAMENSVTMEMTMVLLKCQTDVAMQRMASRSREAEDNVSVAYMDLLEQKHVEMIQLAKADRLANQAYTTNGPVVANQRLKTYGVVVNSDDAVTTIHLTIKGFVDSALVRMSRLTMNASPQSPASYRPVAYLKQFGEASC
jgi:deoxyadenosine/deoxycytidine kinase